MMQLTQKRIAGSRTLVLGILMTAVVAVCLLLAAAAPLATPALAATTFAVDRNDDPDPTTAKACTAAADDCSLRGAIVAANTATGADAVTVPAGTYVLTREVTSLDDASVGDLDITGELTIMGSEARATKVVGGSAPYADRIFHNLPGAKTTITGLTITGGKADDFGGGGVYNKGDLTFDKVVIKDNTASGNGGGILSEGPLNLTDSTVSGNNSANDVGGVYQTAGGIANITNSTISDNKATRFGGGILAAGARINVRNSTIASNNGGGLGGNIISAIGAAVVTKNTIVAGNSVENCNTSQFDGAIFSQGNNISSDGSCGFTQPTDKQNINPLLGPLQNNGGPTDTRALLAGSPAIDAGTNTGCPATDQRGVKRPQNGDGNSSAICDVGAFERNDLTPPMVTTTTPSTGKTGVKRNTSLTATFSEQMDRATLDATTFQLFKVSPNGTAKRVANATVSTTADGLKAKLNPYGTSSTVLAANARYRAVITTAAKDRAGNSLDQDRAAAGSQSMAWTFTTGSR